MNLPRVLGLAFLMACIPLFGQTPDEQEEKPKPPPRAVRFLPVGDLPPFRQEVRDGVRYELEPPPGSIPPRELMIGYGEEEEQPASVALLLGQVSGTLKAPAGAGPLLLRKKGEGDEAVPWLKIDRPESGDFLVILWRDSVKGTWDAARSLVLSDTAESAPAGRARILNLSPVPVAIVYGGEKIRLDPGKSYQRSVVVGKETDIQLGAVDAKGELTRFHSGTIFQNPGERTLVVIYRADGVQPRRPLKAIIQREPVPAPKPVAANPGP